MKKTSIPKPIKCPIEAEELFFKAKACDLLIANYAQLPFCYGKAKRAAREALQHRRDAWNIINTLYPATKHLMGHYEIQDNTITFTEYDNGAK